MVLKKMEQMGGRARCIWMLTYKPDADQVRRALVWLHEYCGMPGVEHDGTGLSCYAYGSGPLTVTGVPKPVNIMLEVVLEAGSQEVLVEACTKAETYEEVCLLLGQLLDSMEIAMHSRNFGG